MQLYNLSNTLIILKNGYQANKSRVSITFSIFNIKLLKILYLEGFINNYFISDNSKIIVKLRYYQNNHIFNQLKIISKPGKRVYADVRKLKVNYYYSNFVLVSTHKGLMGHKLAISKNLGGEVLFSLNYC